MAPRWDMRRDATAFSSFPRVGKREPAGSRWRYRVLPVQRQAREIAMPPRIGHILFGMSRPSLIVCAALTAALVPFLLSQSSVKRPPITGVAHVAIKTNDLAAARRFYGRDLGFSDALAMPERLGPAAWFKVNDHQYLEIYETLKSEDEDRLINRLRNRRRQNHARLSGRQRRRGSRDRQQRLGRQPQLPGEGPRRPPYRVRPVPHRLYSRQAVRPANAG